MKNYNINMDDEVQILGMKKPERPKPLPMSKKQKFIIFLVCALSVIATLICILPLLLNKNNQDNYQQVKEFPPKQNEQIKSEQAFIEVLDETVNDVPLLVYVPHHGQLELSMTMPERTDQSIIFVAEAADVRADNGGIVGDYVLAGQQLAHGKRKEGFCAILDNEIIIGMAGETGILTKAITQKGYFFRQYPLVRDSQVIENEPKGKSIRRAIAIRNNKVIMVESRSRESFHDFAQALVDIGISNAIYLCGGSAFGWYRASDDTITTFGQEKEIASGTNYLVWKSSI